MLIANSEKIRMTKDWLDFSVEHMSKWWKVINFGGGEEAVNRVIGILGNYTSKKSIKTITNGEVSLETLVVIAYQPYDNKMLTKVSLAATLSSLVSVGMGRVVMSGLSSEEEPLVSETFDIVNKQFQSRHQTSFAYCRATNFTKVDHIVTGNPNLPKGSLNKLRRVLLGNATADEVGCWLGEDTSKSEATEEFQPSVQSRYKYIYLTEPDTLFTTRPSSVAALGEKLKEGYVLAPHRLQPLPHGSDFRGLNVANNKHNVVPASGIFEHVYEVDSNEMSCCDAGQFFPMTAFGRTDAGWWQHGFWSIYGNESLPVETAHSSLLAYPLFRLTEGTNTVLVGSEHGRLCRPKSIGVCL